jgi:hypothetical protein
MKIIDKVIAGAFGLSLALIASAGLEVPVYISDLVPANPLASDPASQGDDHVRNIKTAIKNTFPNINGAVTVTDENLNGILSAANITSGTLPVLRGGTGVTTSTGSGNNVLSAAPTLSGTITGGTFAGSHTGDGSGLTGLDAGDIAAGTLAVTRGGTGTTTSTGTGSTVLSASPTFTGTVTAATLNATTLQQGGVGVGRNITGKAGVNKTLSTSAPSGGGDGDIWYRY